MDRTDGETARRGSRTFVGGCALQVEVRIVFIKLHEMSMESKLFLSRSARRDYLQVLAGCDRASRSIIAHAVPFKGADVSWTAESVCRDMKRLGHCGRLTMLLPEVATLMVGFWSIVPSLISGFTAGW